MNTLVISMSITALTLLWMFAFMAGGIYLIISAVVISLLAWYFMIIRTKNIIHDMLNWKGETIGVMTTLHSGGMIEVNGLSLYRERYAEYQFEYLGKTYTSTCVDAIFDVGGVKQANLSQNVNTLLKSGFKLVKIMLPHSNLVNSQDPYDADDPADVLDREVHDIRKVGDKVTVYYNTNNPECSTLVRRKTVPYFIKVNCGAFIVFIVVTHVIQLLTR